MFKALVLEQQDGETRAQTRQLELADLPDGEVLVDVVLSSLNYKDGLAVTGTGKIVRDFPMVPGIDFAGTVAESASGSFRPGTPTLSFGWTTLAWSCRRGPGSSAARPPPATLWRS